MSRSSHWPPTPTGRQHLAFWTERLFGEDRKYVYVIQAGPVNGPIKVGKAIDPLKRLATLQTGNAQPLELLFALPGYEETERVLHHKLADSRISGEWFTGPGVLDFLWWMDDYCNAEKDRYWKTGELPRVPPGLVEVESEDPVPKAKPRMAPRSSRRNRATRLRDAA